MVNKKKKTNWRRLARENPGVDVQVVADSIRIVRYLRQIGVSSSGFNILPSSESTLRVVYPHVHRL